MNYRKTGLIVTLGVSLLLSMFAGAQDQKGVHPVLRADDRKFDSRDLNGIWTRGNPEGGAGGAGACVSGPLHNGPCGDRGFSNVWPSFTDAGQAAFDANQPSYGRRVGTANAKAHPEEHIGRRRAVRPGEGNDPAGTCNPLGITRALAYPQEKEIVMTDDRILQHFSQTNAWRNIWMDGRKLPEIEDIMWPLWYGYSAARWEGDTLVVETVGQDDRVWLDHFGYPISDEGRLEERYRRISHDVLELKTKLTDPKYYKEPWIGGTKKFLLVPKNYFKNSNWPGMYYDDCAPADEVEIFKALVVDPAA